MNAVGVRCANISVRHGNRAHFDDGTFTLEATSQNKPLSDCLAVPSPHFLLPRRSLLEAPSSPCREAGGRGGGAYQLGTARGSGRLEAVKARPRYHPTPALQGSGAWAALAGPAGKCSPALLRGSTRDAAASSWLRRTFFFSPVPQGLRDQEEGMVVLDFFTGKPALDLHARIQVRD